MHCGTEVDKDIEKCPACGKVTKVASAAPTKTKMHPLAIVAIIVSIFIVIIIVLGIIAAIAIPNFLNAMDRGKQKRTMIDLRSIGTAVEEYSIDNNFYPKAATIDELANLIEQKYIQIVPRKDGWGNMIIATSDYTSYTLCSGGKDGGPCTLAGNGGVTNRFNDAIIFSNGQFVQWPEGMQT
jgi:general secretion pathway protein G